MFYEFFIAFLGLNQFKLFCVFSFDTRFILFNIISCLEYFFILIFFISVIELSEVLIDLF